VGITILFTSGTEKAIASAKIHQNAQISTLNFKNIFSWAIIPNPHNKERLHVRRISLLHPAIYYETRGFIFQYVAIRGREYYYKCALALARPSEVMKPYIMSCLRLVNYLKKKHF